MYAQLSLFLLACTFTGNRHHHYNLAGGLPHLHFHHDGSARCFTPLMVAGAIVLTIMGLLSVAAVCWIIVHYRHKLFRWEEDICNLHRHLQTTKISFLATTFQHNLWSGVCCGVGRQGGIVSRFLLFVSFLDLTQRFRTSFYMEFPPPTYTRRTALSSL